MSDTTEPPFQKARTENSENDTHVVVIEDEPLASDTDKNLIPRNGTVLHQSGDQQEQAPDVLDPKKAALLNRLLEKSRDYSRQVLDQMLERQLAMSEVDKESRIQKRLRLSIDKLIRRARRKEEKKEKKRAAKLASSMKKKSSKSRKSDKDSVAKDLEKALRRQHRRERKAQAEGKASEKSTKARKAVEDAQTQHTQTQPKMVHGVMKNFQLDGLAWLVSLHDNGLNGILADEMGLGKTIQCISVFCHLIEAGKGGHFLVVAPLSVVENWCNEFARFAPDIPLLKYWGPKEERWSQKLNISNGVVITTYEIMIRDYNRFRRRKWGYVVVDEGHRIKNFDCLLAQKLRRLRLQSRLLLTGTPLQNNLTELWALLNFILPDMFEDLELFELWFNFDGLGLVDLDHSAVSNQNAVLANFRISLIDNLHQILKPFLLRRLKSEVMKNLPPKKEYIIYTELTPVQALIYNEIMNHRLPEVLLDLYLKEYLMENHPDLHTKPEDFSEADKMLYGKTTEGRSKRLRRTKFRRNDIQRIEMANDSDLMELDSNAEEEEEYEEKEDNTKKEEQRQKKKRKEGAANNSKKRMAAEETILVPDQPARQMPNGASHNNTATMVSGPETIPKSGMSCMCRACFQKQLQPQDGVLEQSPSPQFPEFAQLGYEPGPAASRTGPRYEFILQLPSMRTVALPGYGQHFLNMRAVAQLGHAPRLSTAKPVFQRGNGQQLDTTREDAQLGYKLPLHPNIPLAQDGHERQLPTTKVFAEQADGQQLQPAATQAINEQQLDKRNGVQAGFEQQLQVTDASAQPGLGQELTAINTFAPPEFGRLLPLVSAVLEPEREPRLPTIDVSSSSLAIHPEEIIDAENILTLTSGGSETGQEREVKSAKPTMQPKAAISDVDVIDLTSDAEETPQEMRQSLAWRHHSEFKRQVSRLPLKNQFIQLRSICGSHYVHYTPFDDVAKSSAKFVEALTRNSSKMLVCRSLVRRLVADGHKVLIFSQFVRMLDLIAEILEEDKIKYCQFDGRYGQVERIEQIELFEESSDVSVFLLTTRAGGIGLNLVAADTVILFDSDWNPQQDLQAIARAHRIGQTRPVKVFRLVVSDTTEELLIIKSFGKRLLERMVIREGKFNARSMAQKLADADNNHGLDEIKTLQGLLVLERLLKETRSPGEKLNKLGIKDINSVLTTSLEPGAGLTDEEMAELMDRSPECYERQAWKTDRIQAL